ncbi:DUF551 domain-containing protein [Chitinophaga sp. YIM B06452]|uniref:DUF551 domain-containing protein n=1 Tax=Chitinophaga sp. YIM B06452 TaxID=3082158 RepID=UPI0031FEC0DE
MSNEQKQPQEGKLTAEENIKYAFGKWFKGKEPISFTVDSWNAYCAGFEYAAQQTADKDMRIKELESIKKAYLNQLGRQEEELEIYRVSNWVVEKGKKDAELTALRAELDAALQDHKDACLSIVELTKELEAVKKENEEWKARNLEYSYQVAVKSCAILQDQLAEITSQRDELSAMLEKVMPYFSGGAFLENEARQLLSRLSSGETKPVSPWISIEERLPEPYTEVYGGSFDEDDDFGQTICWHTGDHWEGTEITVDSLITHWAPKLSPPESLTDKK